jgi:hypothetical protein
MTVHQELSATSTRFDGAQSDDTTVSVRPSLVGTPPAIAHDPRVPLPSPRGPLSATLIDNLRRSPREARWDTEVAEDTDPLFDEDLQLTLWLSYELAYRGLAGVDDRWEWDAGLLALRDRCERRVERALRAAVADRGLPGEDATADAVVDVLEALVARDDGPALSRYLMRDADRAQFAEFLVHRSLYHLKEADPHSWAIPRFGGPVKAALITIQADEYGGGDLPAMHAELFRALLADWGLDTGYGHYLEQVPAVTLLASNVMSMFGLHRRWRGAVLGHLALFEMTSSGPNGRYARGHRRLGGGERAARYFDEHVVADAVHEQIAAHQLAGRAALAEPDLTADVIFGAQCAWLTDELFARHTVPRWQEGRSTLRGSR